MNRPAEKHHFLRSAGIVSAAVALSRITGMVREMVMARLFGAGAVNDAFQLAFRIPNLTRNLFAEGALSSAFVPVFTRYLARDGKRAAAELSGLVATALIVVVGTGCAAGMVWSPLVVRLVAPGFAHVPGKFELAVLLTRIMFPFLLLVALAAQAMAALNACDRYGVPALASTWFNLGSVAVGLGLGYIVGRRFENGLIVCMACGVVAGGALQWLWQVPFLARAGFGYRLRVNWNHPGLRQILRLMAPAVLGNAALQINILVNTNLASGLTDATGRVMNGPVSWLGYAYRFMQLPLGLFGAAIASATLPGISRSAALGRMEEFRDALGRSLGLVLLLTIPSAAGLAVLGGRMIAVIYQAGRFTAFDTRQTAMALTCYSAGLTGYAAMKVLAPAFYALGDARTPMLVSLASVAVNLAAACGLARWAGLGYAGLALATSAVALFGSVALFARLRLRTGGLHGRALAATAAKVILASAAMGAICHLMASSEALAGRSKPALLLNLAVSIAAGVLVFYAAARAMRVGEVEAISTACYTAVRNAPRPEAGDPPAGN